MFYSRVIIIGKKYSYIPWILHVCLLSHIAHYFCTPAPSISVASKVQESVYEDLVSLLFANHKNSYAGRYANQELSYREERSSSRHPLFNTMPIYATPVNSCALPVTQCKLNVYTRYIMANNEVLLHDKWDAT